MNVKSIVKTALAAGPLLVGMASPASACLLTPNSETATQHSPQIVEGPEGTGPDAPFDSLQMADETNANGGFSCDPMCTIPPTADGDNG